MPASRIPAFKHHTYPAARDWYQSKTAHGLLFHPDDAAKDMVLISSRAAMFTADEYRQIDAMMSTLFQHHSENVYGAAYPHFISSLQHPRH